MLTSVCVLLCAVIVGILYSLATIIFRQRREHICLLKMLGATNDVVGCVYCGIVLLLLAVVCLSATGPCYAFAYYFAGLCGDIFLLPFAVSYNFYYPIAAFFILATTTVVIWIISNVRIKRGELAKEVRWDSCP